MAVQDSSLFSPPSSIFQNFRRLFGFCCQQPDQWVRAALLAHRLHADRHPLGLAPALRSSRPDLVDTLKDGGGGATGSLRGRALRSWLVIAEISLSVVLLAGASLAVRGFVQKVRTDPGFRPEHVLRIGLTLPPKSYPSWQQRNVLDRNLLASISNLPGVEAA